MLRVLLGVVIVSMATTAIADTIHVNGSCGNDAWTGLSEVCEAPDGPKATIQGGIHAANDGDTVLVADGTYAETVDFPDSEDIVLTSVNGGAPPIS